MWARLLGLDRTAGELDLKQIFFVQPWPLWLTAAALLLAVAWITFLYRCEGRRASVVYKGFLVFLRLAALATLLLVLFQPMLRLQRVEVTPSNVVLLIDRSASMGFRDRWLDPTARARLIRDVGTPSAPSFTRLETLQWLLRRRDLDLLARLEGRHRLHVYEFGAEVEDGRPTTDDRRPTTDDGATGGHRRAERGGLGDGARANADLNRWSLVVGRWSAPDKRLAPATRIGDALARALDDLSGQPLAGIVLVTDGGQNMGEDPTILARRARELGIPIYAVALGDPQPPRDLSVTGVLVDSVVRKGDEVTVAVALQARGVQDGLTAPVTLHRNGRLLASETARFHAVGERPTTNDQRPTTSDQRPTTADRAATVALSFTPQEEGTFTLQVATPALPGEVSRSNNQRTVPIRVVDKKLRILYLESAPRWEYRYLKNAILRDTSIQFACLLTEADARLGGEGNLSITRFPQDVGELFRYDIVILGDVPRETFSAAQLEALRRFVQERGGSLVVIAGERFMPWEYGGTPLADLLPVVLPDRREEIVSDDPFRLQLTDAGKQHPMMLLAVKPEENARIWQTLPGMYWCGVVPRVKPGATVLAVHPTRRNENGPLPLMVVQPTGEGRSFLSLVDSTWQWRFRLGDQYFYRYWGQVLRSLTPHELPGENRYARLTTDRTNYPLGERVTLRARLLTQTFHPLRAPFASGKIVRDDGTVTSIRLLPRPATPGLYETEWLPPRAGNYEVSLIAVDSDQRSAIGDRRSAGSTATTRFTVTAVSLERERPEMNAALLQRVAAAGGGAVVPLAELGRLPDRLRDASLRVTRGWEHELWDTPLPLALFTLFLVGEWVLRKRKGYL
jgi:uncharacterized membrane protein